MLLNEYPQALVLTGPTGSGKSRLALDLAEPLDAEIVSMDSMALYRRMNIGTAKPTAEDRRRVRHHLIDVLEPWESANVAWWLERASESCLDIARRGKRPLFVGGTPLYLKALLHGLFEGPPANESIRRRLTEEADAVGSEYLHAKLRTVDSASADRVHPNDMRRIIRALEVWELTGRPISDWQTQWYQSADSHQRACSVSDGSSAVAYASDSLPANVQRSLCLHLPRSELYSRIDARVEQMVAEGFVEEVRSLNRLERPLSREAAQALGYKELFAFFDGQADLAETVRRIQMRSRNFAKRQMTWFRHLPWCKPIRAELTFAEWGLTML
jgi:tRNA dimethylallyltransferase